MRWWRSRPREAATRFSRVALFVSFGQVVCRCSLSAVYLFLLSRSHLRLKEEPPTHTTMATSEDTCPRADMVAQRPVGLDDCVETRASDDGKRRRGAGQQLDPFGNVNQLAWQAPEGPEDIELYILIGEVVAQVL